MAVSTSANLVPEGNKKLKRCRRVIGQSTQLKSKSTMKNPTYQQLNDQRASAVRKLNNFRDKHKEVISEYLELVNDLTDLTAKSTKALLKELKPNPYD